MNVEIAAGRKDTPPSGGWWGRLLERGSPGTVILIAGFALLLVISLLISTAGPQMAAIAAIGLALLLLAAARPWWLVMAMLVAFAFVPIEGDLVGYHIPNWMQFMVPLLLLAAFVQALVNFDHRRLRLVASDLLVGGFGGWGLITTYMHSNNYKWYSNKMLIPMAVYYIVRLIPLKRRHVQLMLQVLVAAIVLQAMLMIRESMVHSSPLYMVSRKLTSGVRPAVGPFGYEWTAAIYLALWPPIIIYLLSRAKDMWQRGLLVVALLLILGALTRTMERAPLLATGLGIAACALSPRLRPAAIAVCVGLMLAYLPWSLTGSGGRFLGRFEQTDQSRYAYRTAATNYMASSAYQPLGVGYMNFKSQAGAYGTDEEIKAWGTREASLKDIAQGHATHNIYLSLPIEFGLPGLLLAMGVAAYLLVGLRDIRRHAPPGQEVDGGLVAALGASMVVFLIIGLYHNIHTMLPPSVIFWVFYALLVTHPEVFWRPAEDTAEHGSAQESIAS